MKQKYLTQFYFILSLLLASAGYSQTCSPIAVSGFNFDGVAEAIPAISTTDGALDASNYVLFSKTYGAAVGSSYGLADSGIYTVGNNTYALQPYHQDNLLSLTAGQMGSLSFTSPLSYSTVSILGFSTEGAASYNFTINFADGSTTTGTGILQDWFTGSPALISAYGRVGRLDTGATTSGTDPKMFKHDIILSGVNQFKKINNISFTVTSTGIQRLNIMAVSGITNIANDTGQCGAVVDFSLPAVPIVKPNILIAFIDILNLGTENSIKSGLQATNRFNTIDIWNLAASIPTLNDLKKYDAVLLFTNGVTGDVTAIGNRLVEYIDLGGGIVDAVFDNAFDNIGGNYNTASYRALMPANQTSGTLRTLGTINLPLHPIMQGITAFNAGPYSYVSTSTSIAPGAYTVAQYDNNLPLIVARENVGLSSARRVSLNFFPASTTATSQGWDASTQGTEIMVNALKWASRRIYSLSGGSASGSLFPVGITTNSFTYYDHNNALQTYSADIVVKDNEVPVAATKNIIATLDATGSVTITPADVNDGSSDNCPSSVLSLDATTFDCTNLGLNTVTLTITDAAGNTDTETAVVTVESSIITNASQVDVLCHGESTGEATVIATGGSGTYTYSWNTTPIQTTATATGLTAGTYTVTVTDANLCTATQSFTIAQPATALTVSAGSQVDVLCHGEATGEATVTATGGTGAYTYSWSPSGGTAATATGLAAGTYTVTVTDANLCTTTQAFTITEPATALTATADSQIDVLCHAEATGEATVTATGGTGAYTYSWAPSGGTAATATGLTAGTYTVTVTDANLCTATQAFTITEPATALTVSAGSQVDVLCHAEATGEATVTATGGTGAYTYSWSPSGGTAATATGLTAGTYTVTVTDANLCTTTQAFTITEPATALTASADSQADVLCHGESTGEATVTATGGTGAYTYSWSPLGGTAATATGLAAGTYTVTVTDANLCTATQSFTITEPATALTVSVGSQVDVLCHGESTGEATVTATGGTGAYTYNWNTTPVQTTATATGLVAGTYMVTVTDANGCYENQSFTITEPLQPLVFTPNTTHTDVLCYGQATGSATVAVNGGTAPYTYLWNDGQTTSSITGLVAGNYTVTATDANGCTLSNIFTVAQPSAALTAVIGTHTDVLCYGQATGQATVNTTGGTPPYTYSWNTTPAQTTATATGLPNGYYTVTITDDNGCQTTASVFIAQPAAPLQVTTSQVNVDCVGDSDGSITINVTGGTGAYSYQWTPAVSTTNFANNLPVGNYSVIVTDENGCTALRYLTITAPTAVTATFAVVNADCYSTGSATVIAAGGVPPYSYQWSDGNTTATLSNVLPGTYTVEITDANGCSNTLSTTIGGTATIIVSSEPQSVTVDPGETAIFSVTAQNADFYQWQVSTDGGASYSNLNQGGSIPGYFGVATPNLTITEIHPYMDGYLYRVILLQQNGCYITTHTGTLNVTPFVVGIDDVRKPEMIVYPNPASGEVFVKIPDFASQHNMKLTMHDINGRLIRDIKEVKSENYRLDISGVESGIYIITISSDNTRTEKKLIVDKNSNK